MLTAAVRVGAKPGQNDLWIAATAVEKGYELVTCVASQSEIPGLHAICLPVGV